MMKVLLLVVHFIIIFFNNLLSSSLSKNIIGIPFVHSFPLTSLSSSSSSSSVLSSSSSSSSSLSQTTFTKSIIHVSIDSSTKSVASFIREKRNHNDRNRNVMLLLSHQKHGRESSSSSSFWWSSSSSSRRSFSMFPLSQSIDKYKSRLKTMILWSKQTRISAANNDDDVDHVGDNDDDDKMHSISGDGSTTRVMVERSIPSNGANEKTMALLNDSNNFIDKNNNNKEETTKLRKVAKLEKFTRYPIWPIWNGIFLFLLSKLFGEELASKLEYEGGIGGRVCPNFFPNYDDTSPFIMLVHHCHSFAPWDIIRYIQRLFFPEGFPSHAHRGFITVTYILKGGMIHRDSLGTKQIYGAEKRHDGKHTQWLNTGAGLLHEEMWDLSQPDDLMEGEGWWSTTLLPKFLRSSSQELYQLWLNVPSHLKMNKPSVNIIGGKDETPTVILPVKDNNNDNNKNNKNNNNSKKRSTIMSKTIVIAGEYNGKRGCIHTDTDLSILHVQMMNKKNSTWKHYLPSSHSTAIIYVRKGSIIIDNVRVPTHYTAYLERNGSELIVQCSNNNNNNDDDDAIVAADFLLLAGEPLGEPVSAAGSMVMNNANEINIAYNDYQMGKMGVPWDHKLSDDKWLNHTRYYPSIYKFAKQEEEEGR